VAQECEHCDVEGLLIQRGAVDPKADNEFQTPLEVGVANGTTTESTAKAPPADTVAAAPVDTRAPPSTDQEDAQPPESLAAAAEPSHAAASAPADGIKADAPVRTEPLVAVDTAVAATPAAAPDAAPDAAPLDPPSDAAECSASTEVCSWLQSQPLCCAARQGMKRLGFVGAGPQCVLGSNPSQTVATRIRTGRQFALPLAGCCG
jgi:hypothetical protein